MDIHLKGGGKMGYKMYCFRISDEMKNQLKKEAKEKGFTFDVAFTSVLKRANRTLDLILKELNLENIPINKIRVIKTILI